MTCADVGDFSQRIREQCLAQHLGWHTRSRPGYTKLDKPFAVHVPAVPTAGNVDGIDAAGATKHGVCDLLIATETTQMEPEVSSQAEKFSTARRP